MKITNDSARWTRAGFLLILIFCACTAAHAQNVTLRCVLTSDPDGLYIATVKIANIGSEPINGWTLAFDFPPTILGTNNALYVSRIGNRYTLKNHGANPIIPAGGSVTFNFFGTPANISVLPDNYVFNGVPIVAQTATAFSYQGHLSDIGASANGVYDFQFSLYDDGGTQIAQTIERNDLTVTNGLFSVLLDFGEAAFNAENRRLDIKVRRGAETGAFTTLSPRQPITAVPYSINSLNSARLGGVEANQYVLTTDSRLTTTFNISGNGAIGGNLTVAGNISTGCRTNFTPINHGRLCVSTMQAATTFWNAVTVCKNLSARVGNSADAMQTFSDAGFNYFGGLSAGWLADHIGDDTWATWNVTAPSSNFDGAPITVGSTAPLLAFRCVY